MTNRRFNPDPYSVPFVDDEDYLGGGGGFSPPVAPMIEPARPPRTALAQMQHLAGERPSLADPAFKPKPLERVLGGIAAAGAGFAAGYLNSGPRGPMIDPTVGARIGDAITNRRYNSASRDWDAQWQNVANQAKVEGEIADQDRADRTTEARIKSSEAQEAAARAREARYNTPQAPKPIEPLTEKIGNELYERQADGAWKKVATGPAPVVQPVRPTPAQVQRIGNKLFERQGDGTWKEVAVGPAPPPAAGRTLTPAQQAQQEAVSRANALIQQHGSIESAMANAATEPLPVQNALADAKGRQNRANPKDTKSRLKSLFGVGSETPSPAAAPQLPPQAKSQLKEGVVTTFANGQKWTLKNGQPTQVK